MVLNETLLHTDLLQTVQSNNTLSLHSLITTMMYVFGAYLPYYLSGLGNYW